MADNPEVKIISYFSEEPIAPNMAWLAYVILPSGKMWDVRFNGSTKEAAIESAKRLYLSELARFKTNREDIENDKVKPVARGKKAPRSLPSVKKSRGKGQIWVVNRKTGKRARIDPASLAEYESKGFVKGGPRS